MTTNEKKVFHPTLGICTITEYDRKSDRITMISLDGNQSVIPYKNMDRPVSEKSWILLQRD